MTPMGIFTGAIEDMIDRMVMGFIIGLMAKYIKDTFLMEKSMERDN